MIETVFFMMFAGLAVYYYAEDVADTLPRMLPEHFRPRRSWRLKWVLEGCERRRQEMLYRLSFTAPKPRRRMTRRAGHPVIWLT